MNGNKPKSNLFYVYKQPLKLEPLKISQKEREILNTSNEIMTDRLNQSKIIYRLDYNNNEKEYHRMFYSPQSKKLKQIIIGEDQLTIQNSRNEIKSLIRQSSNVLSNKQSKILQRQNSDSIKNTNYHKNDKFIHNEESSIFLENKMFPSSMKERSKDMDDQNKSKKIKPYKGYEGQLLTSIMDLPLKVNRNLGEFSPKRISYKTKLNNQNENNSIEYNKKKIDSKEFNSVLSAYRYDKDFLQLNDEQSKISSICIRSKIQKDQHIKMLGQFSLLKKLYINQIEQFNRLSLNQQNKTENNSHFENDLNQYGEYQSILDKFHLSSLEDNQNIDFNKHVFQTTIFIQMLESLLIGCNTITEQIQHIKYISDDIIFCQDPQLKSKVLQIIQKPSLQDKQITFAEALFHMIDLFKEKENQFKQQSQNHITEIKLLEEEIIRLNKMIETLTEQNKNFDSSQKVKEEEFQVNQQLLLEQIEKKRHLLETEVKRDKDVLNKELAQMERDYKDKIQILEDTILKKMQETEFYKSIYDKQEQRYCQLKHQYDIIFENQEQAVKQLRLSSMNIHNLQEKLNIQDSQIISITQKNGSKFQELTPRPSFRNVDILIEEYTKVLINPKQKDENEETNPVQQQNPNEKNNNIMQEQISTQTKVNNINEFISVLVQKIKRQQQDIMQVSSNKPIRIQKPK